MDEKWITKMNYSKPSKVLQAYYAGAKAKADGRSSNVPKGLNKDQKKAWHNGYNQNAIKI